MTSFLYERVVSVISKPPSGREEREIVDLMPWFQKKSELFRSVEKEVIMDLIRNCQFSPVERDTVVIKQGDTGDSFFIILRGRVSVYVNTDISDKEEELNPSSSPLLLIDQNAGGFLNRTLLGQELNSLESGKAFGELALINTNCIRNASIVADERTDLLVVNRELFNRSLCSAQAADFEARTRFANEHPLFRRWPYKHKRQLAMSIRREKLQFDQLIVKQGLNANALFFLTKGQGKVVIDAHLHRQQFPQLHTTEGLKQGPYSIYNEPKDNRKKVQRSKSLNGDISLSLADQVRKSRHGKQIEVSVVGVNEIIGDTEFALDLKSYVYSVACIQDCEVYSLSCQNYDRLVVRRNPKTVELLRDNAHLKLTARLSRLPLNEVPLLGVLLLKLEQLENGKDSLKHRKKNATKSSSVEDRNHSSSSARSTFLLPRGPLINMYGPGTVYHRNKVREEARMKKQSKLASLPVTRVAFAAPLTDRSAPPLYAEDEEEEEEELSDGEYVPNTHRVSVQSRHDDAEERAVDKDEGSGKGKSPRNHFMDDETSDVALGVLEQRIQDWHSLVTEANNATSVKDYMKLHRCFIEQGKDPTPGVKILVRRRQTPRTPTGVRGVPQNNKYGTILSSLAMTPTPKSRSAKSYASHIVNEEGRESAPFSDFHSLSSCSHCAVRRMKVRGQRSYTAAEYSILKKQLIKCQRQMVKYGIFY